MSDIDEALDAWELIWEDANGQDGLTPIEWDEAMETIRQALERQRAPEAVDMNFLRHLDSVIAGTLNYCQPIPRQGFEDDTEECGAQCLAELESIRAIVKDWLAAAPEPSDHKPSMLAEHYDD